MTMELMKHKSLFIVIVAAGSSNRMNGVKKEFLLLQGETVLFRSVSVFLRFLNTNAANNSRIVIALPQKNFDDYKAQTVSALPPLVKIDYVQGGQTRQESVFNALSFLDSDVEQDAKENAVVLIHDGARPWIDEALVKRVVDAASISGAAVPAIAPVDTLKEKGKNGIVLRHLNRESLAAVQTPQGFWFLPLLNAHRAALAMQGKTYTDDTEIWDNFACAEKSVSPTAAESAPKKCVIVEGSPQNIKITYPQDMADDSNRLQPCAPQIRTGLGYDIHPLVKNRKLVLGGVVIPFDKGEAGHSDGDVLLHAITDALLGASALGDIGSFFPPDDPQYKDADSKKLLAIAWKAVTESGWRLENLDCVIELETPKFLPYRAETRKSIAGVLGVSPERVFVKAKTGEKMGEVGRGEAVKAWASCLLRK
jgi:2-C-methyl-D-erythritol 4-phosphate cytidylyltransferase/2-C-methyl-D-erythritol 2,4-cyclodiphosphate synthase